VKDLLGMGGRLTTAVKCAKTGYAIQTNTVKQCSMLLERELALFPKAKVILLMGDAAIRALNEIARRAGEGRIIPAGSTYKIRAQKYLWRGMRVFPSYLQAGLSFFIEKSKRRMIAEDIAAADATRVGRIWQAFDPFYAPNVMVNRLPWPGEL
jgi:uracil-DNA glycosylase